MSFEKPQDNQKRIGEKEIRHQRSKTKWESLGHKIRGGFERFILAGALLTSSGIAFSALEARMADLRPEEYIEYIENSGPTVNHDRKKLFGQLEKIQRELGGAMLAHLKKGAESAKNSKGTLPTTPTVEGFEELGLSNEAVKELWSERFYPKGTINGNIAHIRLVKASNFSMDFVHGVGKDTAASVTDCDDEITFWENEGLSVNFKNGTKAFSDIYFSHELGHINDWVNDNHLTPTERVEFLFDVIEVFKQPGSFRNAYINSQKNQYSKIVEYWGELCHNFFYPAKNNFFKDHEHEINVIKKWLLRYDPKFDADTAINDRIRERVKIGMLPKTFLE